MASSVTTTKSYLSIKPGETKVLPKSAKILSVINYGNIQYTNTCADFTDLIEIASCYKVDFATDYQAGAATTLQDFETTLTSIEILGVVYEANINMGKIHSPENLIKTYITSAIPQGLMKLTDVTSDCSTGVRCHYVITFQSVPSVINTIKIRIDNPPAFGTNGLILFPVSYDCPSS